MKRAISLLLTVGVVGGFVVLTTASAHQSRPKPPHVATTITHDGDVALGGNRFLLTGQVKAGNRLCRGNRPVEVIAHLTNGDVSVLDTDESSEKGSWSVKADLTGVQRVKAIAVKEAVAEIGFRHHHQYHRSAVCKAAAVAWRVD
ncbi:MAG: hypothetical protein ACRDMH_05020 [Solirubrobacterales bacterium]